MNSIINYSFIHKSRYLNLLIIVVHYDMVVIEKEKVWDQVAPSFGVTPKRALTSSM